MNNKPSDGASPDVISSPGHHLCIVLDEYGLAEDGRKMGPVTPCWEGSDDPMAAAFSRGWSPAEVNTNKFSTAMLGCKICLSHSAFQKRPSPSCLVGEATPPTCQTRLAIVGLVDCLQRPSWS